MNIGFIGIGNMGGAILKGFLTSGALDGERVLLCGRDYEKTCRQAEAFITEAMEARALGVEGAASPAGGNEEQKITMEVCETAEELVRDSDIVFLGVEPKTYAEIMPQVASAYQPEKLLVSMAAGITISQIQGYCPESKVIRIMPNTPAKVNEIMTSISPSVNVSDEELNLVQGWFDQIGIGEVVLEEQIHGVIGVSGSSPAYTYMYIQGLAKSAEAYGMNSEQAQVFAAQAVLGAAKLVLNSSEDLDTLVNRVATPGGATIEAVNYFREHDFVNLVAEGASKAAERSKEMSIIAAVNAADAPAEVPQENLENTNGSETVETQEAGTEEGKA